MGSVLAIGSVLGIFAVVAVIGYHVEKRRRETLRTLAPQMGLDFVETDESGLQSGFAGFSLFRHGRSKRIRNIAYGRVDDVEVMLFDYSYVTGSGKNKSTHDQTVAFFQSDALNLPEFVARPEGLFDKIGQVFGYQDIDLPMHPEFSRQYILRGTDEAAIRDFFRPDVVRLFEGNPGMSVESMPDRFIVYRSRKLLKPEEWPERMRLGLEAVRVMQA